MKTSIQLWGIELDTVRRIRGREVETLNRYWAMDEKALAEKRADSINAQYSDSSYRPKGNYAIVSRVAKVIKIEMPTSGIRI